MKTPPKKLHLILSKIPFTSAKIIGGLIQAIIINKKANKLRLICHLIKPSFKKTSLLKRPL